MRSTVSQQYQTILSNQNTWKLEQKKLEELGNEMISDFSHFGIDLSMIVNVNNEINDEISKEIWV